VQDNEQNDQRPRGVFGELGLKLEACGDDLVGKAEVVPTMLVPDSDILRVSVLAIWADTIIGLIAMQTIAPRVPATLELDIHVLAPIKNCKTVCARARITKSGKSALIFSIAFTDETDRPLAFGHSIFMAIPDPNISIPTGDWALKRFSEGGTRTLLQPLAKRVRCERLEPGVASLPWAADTQNSTKAINGGILAVAIEEAVLSSLAVGEQTLSSMIVRYLRAVRSGPAIATAHVSHGLGQVEVIDSSNQALSAVATIRLFDC
jgi:acyl-coenzyme A thioesterase PaaI-like protein